jgi:Ion channel
MLRRLDRALFDDRSPYLDRFGVLFVLTVVGVGLLGLVDVRAETGFAALAAVTGLTIFIGVTLLVAVRVSGVVRGWRIVVDVIVVIGVVIAVAVLIAAAVSDIDLSGFPTAGRSSPVAWLWTIVAILMPAVIVRRLLHHRHVTAQTVLGAVAAYLLIAVAFDFTFLALDGYPDGPFFGHDVRTTSFMYFSLSTITTLGLGDLAPVGDLGRMLAVGEAVVGQVFLVTFVALVVGLLGQRLAATRAAPADQIAPPPGDDAGPGTNGEPADRVSGD